MAQRLQQIPGVRATAQRSAHSNSAGGVLIQVDPAITRIPVWEISRLLAEHNPVIKTHDCDCARNRFNLDPVFLEEGLELETAE